MTDEEMKNKYSAFILKISEILGLGKPIDILKLCATTDLFFQPLEKRIAELEKENAELKEKENTVHTLDVLHKEAVRKYDKANEQLTKAKELIKRLIKATYGEGWNYSLQVKVEAEKFLKEEYK